MLSEDVSPSRSIPITSSQPDLRIALRRNHCGNLCPARLRILLITSRSVR
jgi:hypothetical protein